LAGDDQTGTFMFNVDVRQGNDQPSLESRFATAPVPGELAPGSLEAEAETGTRSRVLGHSGLSIYA